MAKAAAGNSLSKVSALVPDRGEIPIRRVTGLLDSYYAANHFCLSSNQGKYWQEE